MVEPSLKPEPKSWLDNWRIAAAMFAVLVSLGAVLAVNNRPKPFVYPHIKAPPYISQPGCERIQYTPGGYISSNCVKREYRFRDIASFGIEPATRAMQFYRINNDLLDLTCGIYANCTVNKVYTDAFYQ